MALSNAYKIDDKFDPERFDPRNLFFGTVTSLEGLSNRRLKKLLSEASFTLPKESEGWNLEEINTWNSEIAKVADFGAIFVRALSETPYVQKLRNELQSPSTAHTTAATKSRLTFKAFQTTRYDHSMGVCDEAFKLAINSNYSTYETMVALSVGALHDIGHIAFSHTGEEILHEMGFKEFDHDLYSALLACDPEYKEICKNMSIDHKDVIAALIGPKILKPGVLEKFEIMQEKLSSILGREFNFTLDLRSSDDIARVERWSGLHVLVQDYADMFAYGKSDVSQSLFATDAVKRYVQMIDEASDNVSNPEGNVIETSSLEPLRKFQGIYVNYTSKFPLSYPSATFASFVQREILDSGITIKDMLTKNGAEIIEMLPAKAQDILKRGVDDEHIPAIEVRPPHKIKGENVDNREIAARITKKIHELIKEGSLSEEFTALVCPTSPIHKKSELRVNIENSDTLGPLKGIWGKIPRPIIGFILNKKEYRATDQVEVKLSSYNYQSIEVTADSYPTVCISLERENLRFAPLLIGELNALFESEFQEEGSGVQSLLIAD